MKLFRYIRLLLLAFMLTGTVNITLAQQRHISYSKGESTPDEITKNYFELAYKEIKSMLEGKDSLNYERAVFITENAYWDNKIDYRDFQSIIDFHTKKISRIAQIIKEANQDKYATLRIYEKKMFDLLAANAAIHQYMTGSSRFVIDSQVYIQAPLHYSKYDPYGTENWTNSQVFSLLSPYREAGNCYAWVTLFKIYSERLKSDAYISTAPHHVYIQHRDIRGGFHNVELSTNTFPGDGTIETLTYTTREGLKNRIAMRRLNLKESITLCLIYLAKGYEYKYGEKDADFSLRCSNLALKHDSLSLNAMLLKANVMEEILIKYMNRQKIEDVGKLGTVPETKDLFCRYEKWIAQLSKLGYREIPSDVQDILLAKAKGEIITNYKDRTPDPFPSLDVEDVRSYTLSAGMFDEEHRPQKFMQYGRTILDTETGRITKIIKVDSATGYKVDPVVFALSIDPLASKYPMWSPYSAFANNPVRYTDTDGREPIDPRTGKPFYLNLNRAAVYDLSIIEKAKLKLVKDEDLYNNANPLIARNRDKPDGAWDGASAFVHESVWMHTTNNAIEALDKLFPGIGKYDYGAPNDEAWRNAATQGTYVFVDDRYSESEVFFINQTSFNFITVEQNYITQIVNMTRPDGDGKYNINSVTKFDIQKGNVQTRSVKTWWGGTRQEQFRTLTVTETTETYKDNQSTGQSTSKTYTTEEIVK